MYRNSHVAFDDPSMMQENVYPPIDCTSEIAMESIAENAVRDSQTDSTFKKPFPVSVKRRPHGCNEMLSKIRQTSTFEKLFPARQTGKMDAALGFFNLLSKYKIIYFLCHFVLNA